MEKSLALNKEIFDKEVIKAIENSISMTKEYDDEVVSPIILFKSIIDLEPSDVYDYLNCHNTTGEIEEIFSNLASAEYEDKKKNGGKAKIKEYYFDIDDDRKFIYCEDIEKILSKAKEFSKLRESSLVQIEDLTSTIVENIPDDISLFLRELNVDTKDFRKVFQFKNPNEIIPIQLKPFMKVLNDDYKKGDICTILCRDKECERVWTYLQKKTKRNAILTGEPGVGKTSIARKIAQDIVNETCPKEFIGFYVVTLDVTSIVAGTKYRGEAEQRFADVVYFIEKNNNVILFIDEIHLIVGAGKGDEDPMDFANSLKTVLAEDKSRVIGATTIEEYEKHIQKDGAIERRFSIIEVKEPKSDQVYPMIKNKIKELSKYHQVTITPKMVEFVIFNSAYFNYTTKNPDRTLDLIDMSMVTAKNAGKKSVDKESVLKNFEINFELFNNMDDKTKKIVSYHESGHYVAWRFSGLLNDMKTIAISIMPAEKYLGVNVNEDEEVVVIKNYNYYIDQIAYCLAGRVAQEMYGQEKDAGAESDIKKANKIAYDVITKYGMAPSSVGTNRIFINNEDYTMLSERIINNIDKEIKKMIDEAYKRAKEILRENKIFLDKLVNELMKKGMLNAKELDMLYEKTYLK